MKDGANEQKQTSIARWLHLISSQKKTHIIFVVAVEPLHCGKEIVQALFANPFCFLHKRAQDGGVVDSHMHQQRNDWAMSKDTGVGAVRLDDTQLCGGGKEVETLVSPWAWESLESNGGRWEILCTLPSRARP